MANDNILQKFSPANTRMANDQTPNSRYATAVGINPLTILHTQGGAGAGARIYFVRLLCSQSIILVDLSVPVQ